MNNKYGVFAKEVYMHLDINPATLRNWSSMIENHGYEFEKNHKGQRIYYQREIFALANLKTLLAQRESLESATKAVAAKLVEEKSAEKAISAITEKEEDENSITLSKSDLDNYIDNLERKFSDFIAKRDALFLEEMQKRDKLLLEAITKMQLQVAASKEAIETSINDDNKDDYKNEHTDIILNEIKELKQQINASQAEGKKGLFQKLFGKD
ncbi:hypothetical protein CN395_28735 [Priestia megaterium]|uniref:hypothetical protein n=1 Tax=Priestia megaterium TaxID=1404 RepID=UPI000BF3F4C1|nr:hypothetical protein [Priestia megaterium]PEU51314.1 hypothetical protein CN395_28735 [Priestia megaterium]